MAFNFRTFFNFFTKGDVTEEELPNRNTSNELDLDQHIERLKDELDNLSKSNFPFLYITEINLTQKQIFILESVKEGFSGSTKKEFENYIRKIIRGTFYNEGHEIKWPN